MRFTNVNWLSRSPSTPANMASADPTVTASPSSHVGIANVRNGDATRRWTRGRAPATFSFLSFFLLLFLSRLFFLEQAAASIRRSRSHGCPLTWGRSTSRSSKVSVSISLSEPPMHLFRPESLIDRRSSWPDQHRSCLQECIYSETTEALRDFLSCSGRRHPFPFLRATHKHSLHYRVFALSRPAF